ncbi:agmatinase [Malassezia nana]|uniref:Agmatinase n=1 Tax=Malassezia nana TaxID=180528 RepID=A0AAF0ETK4_9BASI|nr:agmatinase [Malassezia nana]
MAARQTVFRSFNPFLGINPYVSSTKFLDCGDVPVTPFDNAMALEQIEKAYDDITSHPVPTGQGTIDALPHKLVDGQKVIMAKDGKTHPRVAVMGGDHSVALPILRSLYKLYDPVSVIHFDSHLDTWAPAANGDAASEGLIRNASMHVDRLGAEGTAAAIRERVIDTPVYISIDIDVLDPSIAPGTGTPVSSALTSRELRSIVRQLQDFRLVGCEVVESLLYELMSIMALHPLDKAALSPHERPTRPSVRTPSDPTRSLPLSRWEAFEAGAHKLYTHVLVPSIHIVGALTLLAVLTVVLQSCAKRVLT